MTQTITLVVSKDGKVTADYEGFQGTTCFEESGKLLEGVAKLGVKSQQKDVRAKAQVGKVGIHDKQKLKH